MARFYRKRSFRRGPKDKYSVENKAGAITFPNTTTNNWYQSTVNVVPPTSVEGMRKVKHVTVSLCAPAGDTGCIAYALVYVPEGYNTNPLFSSASSLYEPNQFVMQCGLMDFNAGPIRISSPISRNLNSGDSIWLVVGTQSVGGGFSLNYFCKYAITLQ